MTNSPLLIFLICAIATTVTGTDHIVGANKAFRYAKNQYNVFQVNQTGYDNCTIDGATGNWSKGKDFILLGEAKRYYFICGTGGCFNGMKVTVVVHPLPSPPGSSASPAKHDDKSSAVTQVGAFRSRAVVLSGLVVYIAAIWFENFFDLSS
ncbi:hypothetical protein GIB67_026331 [Kingdonia uniflora]|uniref:Phytocyanin domain-containing protein n=1 Tax=Kingdonia uniflora TaxID=39325 RepID=A0A7J7N5W8_9MAGN|nr:hypothetical protein GIB67_026331 [Kingdonia uniflora]